MKGRAIQRGIGFQTAKLTFALVALFLTSAAIAMPSATSEPINTGCDRIGADVRPAASAGAPVARKVDPITQREFMSFSLDDAVVATGGDTSCWQRLDGVWQEQTPISIDETFEADGWTAATPALKTLAHGVYTRPDHIVLELDHTQPDLILVRFPFSGERPAEYVSQDQYPLDEVLQVGGPRKTYVAQDRSILPEYRIMEVDVSRTGYVRLHFNQIVFQRPRPGTSRSEWSEQISDRDPFMIGFTLENIIANRKGYDIVAQDPLRFLQNAKAEVFSHARQGYAIDEKRIIPLGLKLVKEDIQGATQFTSALTTEQEYQRATRSSFGVGGSISGPLKIKKIGKIKAGLSFGYKRSQERFQSLKQSAFVAEETGTMRHKKYALVLDPAYASLSDHFIDAVEDAVRDGDFEKLIEQFGTHYPYAMTYGAAGQMSQFISREGFSRAYGSSIDERYKGSLKVAVLDVNGFYGHGSSSSSAYSQDNEYGRMSFFAVGGNGSWNQSGFVAGDAQYPILADLRPLDELLNEINFPGEPDIYDFGRRALADAIESYLERHRYLSDANLFPASGEYRRIEGCWGFTDAKGRRQLNLIERPSDQTLVARRHGSSSVYEYVRTRDHTFRAVSGSGTYYFGKNGATWSAPNSGGVVRLSRIGDDC